MCLQRSCNFWKFNYMLSSFLILCFIRLVGVCVFTGGRSFNISRYTCIFYIHFKGLWTGMGGKLKLLIACNHFEARNFFPELERNFIFLKFFWRKGRNFKSHYNFKINLQETKNCRPGQYLRVTWSNPAKLVMQARVPKTAALGINIWTVRHSLEQNMEQSEWS